MPILLESRLRPPQSLLALVRRERLLSRLSAAEAPLIVVSAPGGFGKTVTLSQWAASCTAPVAWLQAAADVNDPLLLLQYLTAALGGVIDVDPQVMEWLGLAPPPVETRILPALAAAVAGAAPFVLVIDDAHLLTNEACWSIVGLLVEQLPSCAHVCLSGRGAPPLRLARSRTEGRLLELGPPELALSCAEAGELLRLHGVIADAETTARLTEVTEGWAAGLSLAALAGKEGSAGEVPAAVRGDRRDIAGYLASEVLEQQPPAVTEFLLHTSILERLSPSLCRAVTGSGSAGDLLQAVAHSYLFVSAVDDRGEWFRYHHLFAEFLQAELLRRDEDDVAALHRRAAAWLEAHDELEAAVRHWLAAGEAGFAGEIICRCHMDFTRLARYETLRRWLEMFSDEQILADHALTLAAGWIGAMAGDSPRSRLWISATFRAEVGDAMWPGAPVPLRAMKAGLIAALAPGGVTQMRDNAEIAVSLSGGAPASERSVVVTQLGIAHWLSGDAPGALPLLKDGEGQGATGNVLAQVVAVAYQALILGDEGCWDAARTLTADGLRRVEDAGLSWGLPVFPLLLAQARLQARDGDAALADSITAIERIVEDTDTIAPFMSLAASVLVGEIVLERGDLVEATRWMRAGFALLAAWPDAGILGPRLLRLRERIEARRLLEPLTPAERRVLELLPTELSLKEIARRLYVSPETVRTHAKDVYRKLEVHARSEAVARARELELLRSP